MADERICDVGSVVTPLTIGSYSDVCFRCSENTGVWDCHSSCSADVVKLWSASPPGRLFVRRTFILNEIWAQDKMCILVGTLLVLNSLFITYC
jgi:hypothetical protein